MSWANICPMPICLVLTSRDAADEICRLKISQQETTTPA
jgi:hypothetical protein